jgi:hypothetical protein
MYLHTSQFEMGTGIKVTYRESFDSYSLKFGSSTHLVLKQDEVEELYNEILGAMMHRRFSTEGEVIEVWEN